MAARSHRRACRSRSAGGRPVKSCVPSYTSVMAGYRVWLRDNLKRTIGGQLAVSLLLLIGVAAGAIGTGFAFYNVESGHDPDQALGLQIVFSWVVAAVLAGILVGIVVAVDAAFRKVVARFANPSSQ
jgi:hypothetical protein